MTTDPYQEQPHPSGPMSLEEYLQLEKNAIDEKYEYVGGVARLLPGASGEHSHISLNIVNAIHRQFQSGPCFVHGFGVQVLISTKPNGKDHYFYPDASVSCDVADRRRGTTLIHFPRLMVEVLSPSTEIVDRGKKLEAYKACPTIQEIVLIDQFMQAIEVYRRDEEDGAIWRRVFYSPGSTVELSSIDVYIPIDDIYKGIDFDEPLVDE